MTLGAVPAPETEQLDPPDRRALGRRTPKTNQPPKLGREPLSDGPNEGPPSKIRVLPVP